MADVLCVYRRVKILKKAEGAAKNTASDPVLIISPGIQAIATTAPDLPQPGVHATFTRDHEYKRHGTISLLAGIDLVSGKLHALVKDRHRSGESGTVPPVRRWAFGVRRPQPPVPLGGCAVR